MKPPDVRQCGRRSLPALQSRRQRGQECRSAQTKAAAQPPGRGGARRWRRLRPGNCERAPRAAAAIGCAVGDPAVIGRRSRARRGPIPGWRRSADRTLRALARGRGSSSAPRDAAADARLEASPRPSRRQAGRITQGDGAINKSVCGGRPPRPAHRVTRDLTKRRGWR